MSGNLKYDFPRLAKESGFYFHFRNRQVEWEEIAELDIEDIATNRKFHVLEEKLPLVINCDLGESITQVLDKNFIKIFRLAQLSVSYLRHCQTYLDKCVLCLEEKLAAAKEECNALKASETEKKWQCDECDKKFLSANYLESHQKRRHNNLEYTSSSCQTDDITPRKPEVTSKGQQTDDIDRASQCAQTDGLQTRSVGSETEMTQQDYARGKEEKNELERKLAELQLRINNIEAKTEELQGSAKEITHTEPSTAPDISQLVQQLVPIIQKELQVKTKGDEGLKDEPLLIDLDTPSRRMGAFNETDSTESSARGEMNNSLQVQKRKVRRKIYIEHEKLVQEPMRPPLSKQGTMLENISRLSLSESDLSAKEGTRLKKVAKEASRVAKKMKDARRPITSSKSGWASLEEDIVPYEEDSELAANEIENMGKEKFHKPAEQPSRGQYQQLHGDYDDDRKETTTTKLKQKSFLKSLLKKSSPNLRGIHSSLKKSWSNLYERKKGSLLERSRSEDVLDGREVGVEGMPEKTLLNTLAALKRHQKARGKMEMTGDEFSQERGGIAEETIQKTVAALKHHQQVTQLKKAENDFGLPSNRETETPQLKMRDVSSETGSDYSVNVIGPEGKKHSNYGQLPRPKSSMQERERVTKISSPNGSIDSMIKSFLDTRKEKVDTPDTSPATIAAVPQALKPKNMYDFDSSSIESIKDAMKIHAQAAKDPGFKEKTTDFSIFQVRTPTKEPRITTDSESDVPNKENVTPKSSIPAKPPTVKRVVFADNVELDINPDLLTVPKQDVSDAGSWDSDTPML